jgi:hypothetical protein
VHVCEKGKKENDAGNEITPYSNEEKGAILVNLKVIISNLITHNSNLMDPTCTETIPERQPICMPVCTFASCMLIHGIQPNRSSSGKSRGYA